MAESSNMVRDRLCEFWTAAAALPDAHAQDAAQRALAHLRTTSSAFTREMLEETEPGSTAEAEALQAVVGHDHSLCDNALDCY